MVFTVQSSRRYHNSDTIQGHNSGCDSEVVNREKTVNRDSGFDTVELRYQLNKYISLGLGLTPTYLVALRANMAGLEMCAA